jgi:hypothetical protein
MTALSTQVSQPLRKSSHLEHKTKRSNRLTHGIYGEVKQPIIEKNVIGLWEPPSYIASGYTVKFRKASFDKNIDWRCFYSGVLCSQPVKLKPYCNDNSKLMPWLGTKDHLIPLRRGCDEKIDINRYPVALVWSSQIVNQTLGLAPFLIRLKIREWLSTTPFDRNDSSIDAAQNLKWIIINMLDEFRIKGRYPWSRKLSGAYWYPEVSIPLMQKWYDMETTFLLLNENDRDQYIKSFAWQF